MADATLLDFSHKVQRGLPSWWNSNFANGSGDSENTFCYVGVAIASPFFLRSSWVYAAVVFPFAFMLLKEFFRVYRSEAQQRWFAFFMWTNISMLVFIFVPVIDKWNFLFIGRV